MQIKKSIPALMIYLALLWAAVGLSAACDIVADAGSFFASGNNYREDFQKSFPLSQNGSFSLKNTNGYIHVSTWTKGEVEIKAVKIAKRRKEDLDRVRIEVDARADSVSVDTVYEKRWNLRVHVDYDIKVPEGVRLEKVRSTNGDIELSGRFADVKASTTNGDLKLEGASGHIVLSTTNGGIKASEVKGPVDAHTTNGSILIDLRSVESGIDAETTNGSITLKAGAELNAELRAHTTNGRIRTDFPITIQGLVQSRKTVEGKLGSGGPTIDLRTTNGSITLSR
jgi:DUF4097 and DUF4098 domain-containing protein YvlB